MSLSRLPFSALVLASAALLTPMAPASAATVYDSGVGASDATYLSPSYTGTLADPDDDYELADDITLASAYDIGSATFIGAAQADEPLSFDIAFYAVGGAGPEQTATASRTGLSYAKTDAGVELEGKALQTYAISFDVITLTAGNWWVSIVANTPDADKWHWAGVYNNTSSVRYREAGTEGIWGTYTPLDMAVSLDSAAAPVPLPAALPLMGAGLAGLALIGRRRRS